MRLTRLLSAVVVFFLSVSCWGQRSYCDPTGTWYGGSDPHSPYIMTIAPLADGRYSTLGQQAIETNLTGYANVTHWTGELKLKSDGQTYEATGMAFWTWPQQLPDWALAIQDAFGITIDPSLPELDFLHARMEFVGCNTYRITYDLIGAFENFDIRGVRQPYVSNPDIDFLALYGVTEIVETYHRMPTSCSLSCYLPMSGARIMATRPQGTQAPNIPRKR